MSGLRALQQAFRDYVLSGETSAIAPRIADSARAGAAQRLAVYGEAYRLRLLEALESDFRVLKAVLGDEGFERVGRRYIDAHPSRHFSIRWFGAGLADSLHRADEAPWLAELAAFEWAMTEVFDAADAAVVTVADVAAVAPEHWPGMRLFPHPSVRRLDLHWAVAQLWKDVQDGGTPSPPARTPQPVAWVLWRRELTNYFRSLTVPEAWALDAAGAGSPFADLCQGLCEWFGEAEAPLQAAGLLKGWVQEGLIGAVETGG